ncbi:pre-mRNA-splicing factor 38A-like [Symsagittifera roscoffensis]|uniref:pre-mRNA-splicing factor 38A-like n=1 Tax=Symsagittifera roscoffensis TaxID=84072 RepID=UPI00307C55B9
MANRTVKDANTIHGTNPQYLVEKIIRSRIYDCKYWKEHCFALTSEILVDRAMELRYVGGSYGANIKVTPFMCLLLKMLQIQPDKDVIVEFIKQQDFKYVRCLGAVYLRLTFSSLECYKYLEPLLVDYRKIRCMNSNGEFVLSYVDEFIDKLLTEDKSCSIVLPRLTKRIALEDLNQLQPKVSALEEDLEFEEDDASSDEEPASNTKKGRDAVLSRSRSTSPIPTKRKRSSRSRSKDKRTGNSSKSAEKKKKKSDKKEKKSKSSRKEEQKSSRKKDDDDYHKDSLSISETNKLRASLGLAPLVE